MDDIIKMTDLYCDDEEWVDSGIYGVNQFAGGFVKDDVTVICAGPGGGKSYSCLYSAVNTTARAIYLSLENSISTDYKRLKEFGDNINERLYYMNPDAELGFNCDALDKLLEESSTVDIVYVDSIDYIVDDRELAEGGSYAAYGYTMKRLREIAKKHNVAVVVTAQLNRTGGKQTFDDITLFDIADSIRIGRVAHDMWVVSYKDDWAMKNLKARSGGNQKFIKFCMKERG